MKLDFVCLGGNKCGTTWLYEMLKQHPQLNLSITKEPHFFTYNRSKTMSWYESNWEKDKSGLKGECSTSYLYSIDGQRKIKDMFPYIKVFIVLRNPLDRSISHCRHLLRKEYSGNVYEYIRKNYEIVENSLYFNKVVAALEIFGQDNVKLLLFDDIAFAPEKLLYEAFTYLGVDSKFVPERYNCIIGKGYDPTNKFVEKTRVYVQARLKRLGLHKIVNLVKRTRIVEIGKGKENMGLKEEIRSALSLYNDLFIRDIELLKQLNILSSCILDNWIAHIKKV